MSHKSLGQILRLRNRARTAHLTNLRAYSAQPGLSALF
ncbi:hypothetical protein EPIB1_563 [Tritonibacter mobilis]|nr:hypothetical protein EPIB1_563 [Tritonibacter mobilis]